MTPFSPAEDTFGSRLLSTLRWHHDLVRAGEQRRRHGGSVQLQSAVGEGSEFIC
jgi:hypothetical protein